MMARAITPLALFLVLLAGGSVQRPLLTLAVQLGACALLGWALSIPTRRDRSREGRRLLLLLMATLALMAAQCLPLPPSLWHLLPGRTWIVAGDRLLGLEPIWRPWSLDPSATASAALTLIVPAAFFLAILRREPIEPTLLLGSALAAILINALLGIAQVVDGTRRFYLFPDADWSAASGFFANPNHLGALLLISVPLAVGLALHERGAAVSRPRRLSLYTALATLGLSLLAVTPLNASLAVALLGIPVVLFSALIPSWGDREPLRRRLSVLLLVGMATGALLTYLARQHLLALGQTGFATRSEVWKPSLRALADTFPFGSGFGSFPRYFPHFEQVDKVSSTWVNHVHNDYLELVLEGGAPALALVILFLAWWGRRASQLWWREDGSALGRAAVIASAVLLIHSCVDYPLRTPALAGLMGVLIAMMVIAVRPRPLREDGDLWTTRHWTVV